MKPNVEINEVFTWAQQGIANADTHSTSSILVSIHLTLSRRATIMIRR